MRRFFTLYLTLMALLLNSSNADAQAVTIASEGFDTCKLVGVPTGWTVSNVFPAGPYTYGYAQWGKNISGGCYLNGDGQPPYGYYPIGCCSAPYTYATPAPSSHTTANASNCTKNGVLWYGAYYNSANLSKVTWGEAASPALNLAGAYPGNGTFRVSFWVYGANLNAGYTNALVLYVNTSPKADGGTRLDSILPFNSSPFTSSFGWVKFTYTIPYTYYSSPSVNIIFKAYGNYSSSFSYYYDINVDDYLVQYIPPCTPPSSQPTNISLATGASIVNGSFTAASPAPSGGYVVVRTLGTPLSFTPANNKPYKMGDSVANGRVVYSGPSITFTDSNLLTSTPYTYTIFSYTADASSCSGPVYNTTSPLVTSTTTLPVTRYTWTGGNGVGDWTVPTNWSPVRTLPDPSDLLTFNNGYVTAADTIINIPQQAVSRIEVVNNTIVVLQAKTLGGTGFVRTLFINTDGNPATNELDIEKNSSLIINGSQSPLWLSFTGPGCTANISGSLELVNNGAVNTFNFANCNATVGTNGTLAIGGSSAASCVQNASPANLIINGNFEYKYTSSSGPGIPLATWATNSNLKFSGFTTAPVAPVLGMGQSFYNVTYSCANQTSNLVFLPSGGSFNAAGSFVMQSTGTGSLILSNTLGYSFNIGSYSQTSGVLDLSGATTTALQVMNVGGSFNQTGGTVKASNISPVPNVTINYTGNSPRPLVYFNSSPLGPITYRVSNPNGIELRPSGSLILSPVFAINQGGGIRVSVTNTNPILTALTINYAQINSSLTFDTIGSCTMTATLMPVLNQPTNLYVNVGAGNVVNVNVPSVTIADSLIFQSGDINLGNNSLTIGLNAVRSGIIEGMGNVRLGATGSMTRWISASQVPTTYALPYATAPIPGTAPAAGITTTSGYFPITYGLANRNVLLYFNNTSALATGGTVTVTHNPAYGQTPVSIADGSYLIQARTNASWLITPGNGLSLVASGASLGLKITGSYLYNPKGSTTTTRLLHATGVAGVHVNGGWVTPIVGAQREQLQLSDLSTPFYIGDSSSHFGGIFTAYNPLTNPNNWTTAATWDRNQVPTATDICVINPGVNVVISSSGCVAHSVTNLGTLTFSTAANKLSIDSSFTNSGTVNMTAGTLQVNTQSGSTNPGGIINNAVFTVNGSSAAVQLGSTGGGNKPFMNVGTLNVQSGNLNVNGNLRIEPGSIFNQSGGSISIDGNAGGSILNSVSFGTPLLNIRSYLLYLTGGTLTIVDPHVALTEALAYNISANGYYPFIDSPSHTISFGDGVSTDPGGVDGFYISPYTGNGFFQFGNLVINGGAGTNRYVTANSIGLVVRGDMTIKNGGEYRQDYGVDAGGGNYQGSYTNLYLNGNLTVNSGGTLTADSTIYFCYMSPDRVPGSSTRGRQYVTGGGSFRNAGPAVWNPTASPSGNLTNISVRNSSGVYFNTGNLSYTNKLLFNSANGTPSRIFMQNNSILSEGMVTGYNPGTPYGYGAQSGWIVGAYQKHTEVGNLNFFFPIGDSVNYTPVSISSSGTGAVTNAGDIWVKSNPGNHPSITSSTLSPVLTVQRSYTVTPVNGITFKPGSLSATFNWVPSDVATNTNISYLQIAVDSVGPGGTWRYPQTTPPTYTSITAIGLSPLLAGDYQIAQGCPPTIITRQPTTQSGCIGGAPVTFNVAATGSGLKYQWFKNGTQLTSQDSANSTFVIFNPSGTDTGKYYVRITGLCAAPVLSDTTVRLNIGAAPPVIIQPLPQTVCAGTTLNLSGLASGTGIRYTWRRNGVNLVNGPTLAGSVISGQGSSNLTISYAATSDTGHYDVVVANSCASGPSYSVPVNVNAAPPSIINASGPVTFCGGSGVTLSANTGINYSYKWLVPSIPAGNDSTLNYLATVTGTYRLVVTNANFCTDTSVPVFVNANALPSPVVSALGATTFCHGDSVQLTSGYNPAYFYQWYLVGSNPANFGAVAGATGNTFGARDSGLYYLTVTSSNNCYGTSNFIKVNAISLPQPTVTASGTTTICAGGSVLLNTPPGAGLNYQWIQDTGSIVGAVGSSYAATSTGNYKVTVKNGSCSATSNAITVNVNSLPGDSLFAAGGTTICQGATVILITGASSSYSYQWLMNGSPIAGARNASTYTANQGGAFSVKVTDIGTGCNVTTGTVNITVNPSPVPVISLSGGATLSTVGIYSSYQWNYNGAPIPGATSATYTATRNGIYTVTVTDAFGCTGTSALKNVLTVGVANVTGNDNIRIYPNPASSIVHIDAPYLVNVSVSSLEGKEVLYKERVSDIDISKFADGVYLIKVSNAEGTLISIQKLVKSER